VTYLLPVVAIVLGVLVLGETVTVTVLAGIALISGGFANTEGSVGANRGTVSAGG
jgi:drug/metabolite transporter (DMT)-like permease